MINRLAEATGRIVPRETINKLETFAELLTRESKRQNLVSESSLESLWSRHILDSAQLIRFESEPGASWVDIGSGAGLPGLVVALLIEGPVTLIEPRRLRADFLNRAVEELALSDQVRVAASNAQTVEDRFDMITARAVARLDRLLAISTHLSTRKSRWVLPKGRSAQSELAEARRNWQADAQIVPSLSDPESEILILENVKAKGGR